MELVIFKVVMCLTRAAQPHAALIVHPCSGASVGIFGHVEIWGELSPSKPIKFFV
jgi:hypothetical protein